MGLPKIAVVILNWNGKSWLSTFLPSVTQHSLPTDAYEVEVVVADNCSTDDSVAYVKKHFPAVSVVENAYNAGYAGGYNLALQQVQADVFVLLNSDVEVTPGWLHAPVMRLLQNDEIASVQPKICSYQQKNFLEYAGGAGGFIDRFGYPFCRGRIFSTLEEDTRQYNTPTEIFWASGACLFVKASCFREAGELDEDFFAHMEEIDLCWRLKNLGYTCWYEPSSLVYHVGGGTLQSINPRKTYLNFRNNLFMLVKNLPRSFFTRTILLRMILDGIAAIKFVFQGNPRHAYAVFSAHMSFYRHFTRMYKKRPEGDWLQKKLKLSCVYRRLVVFDYYVKGKTIFSTLKDKDFY